LVIIKGWEERNGFVPSEQIVSNEDIRQLETNVVEPVVFNIDKKDIFVHIYGHDPLKIIFKNAISNEEPVHILLTGAPGTAKTLFLEAVGHSVPNAKFITSNSTGSGILTVMFEDEKLKYLCIDEIEKIPRDRLAVLLTLMESRRLVVTKKTMMVDREQKVTIFAMCNKIDRLSPELQSRFEIPFKRIQSTRIQNGC
jgi:MoxR-like ATPase